MQRYSCLVPLALAAALASPAAASAKKAAKPQTYRAYVRFSNGMGRVQSDARPDVRGVAIKVVGVAGKKIIPGLEDARTQDFLLIRTPSIPFADADAFVWFVLAARSPALLPARALFRFGPFGAARVVAALARSATQPTLPLAGAAYFSAASIQCGRHAARYSLAPREPAPRPPAGRSGGEFLGAELAERLARAPVVYDFRLQFYCDPKRTPIEDYTRAWSEEDAPWVTVAELTLPQQQIDSERGRRIAEYIETLSFDPWHASAELRPLGNIMRARNHAYRLSTGERRAVAEPDGRERFD